MTMSKLYSFLYFYMIYVIKLHGRENEISHFQEKMLHRQDY